MASPGLRDWDLFCYIPYLTKVNVLLPRHNTYIIHINQNHDDNFHKNTCP